MESHTIEVNIAHSLGAKQMFQLERPGLDCGSGLMEIRPDEPAFCRGFDRVVLTLDQGDAVTTMTITGGMAYLTGKSVHVVCEKAVISPPRPQIPPAPSRIQVCNHLIANPCFHITRRNPSNTLATP